MLNKLVAASTALAAAAALAAVDVNQATQAELEAIAGIGPTVSTTIVKERKSAAFKDWNDLVVRVPGVGDRSAARFSEGGLTVNGQAYPGKADTASRPARQGTDKAKTKATTKPATKGSAAGAAKK